MPAKTEADTPFQTAQKSIRACVMAPDKSTFFTWYHSGNVTVTANGEAEQAGRAWNLQGFNALLERHGIVGLQGRGAPKCPERLVKA